MYNRLIRKKLIKTAYLKHSMSNKTQQSKQKNKLNRSIINGKLTNLIQAKVLQPPIFMAQDPQMPSRHDLLKVNVGSISFFILIRASRIMGPQVFKSTSYSLMYGFSLGFSGSHLYTANFLLRTFAQTAGDA